VPPKVAAFAGYRHDFGRKIAWLPRRYAAEKIFRWGPEGLWIEAAAVQQLAFLLLGMGRPMVAGCTYRFNREAQ